MTQALSAETLATVAPLAMIDRAALHMAAAIAALPVERRNTIPILSNLRMIGAGDSLEITGTDLDTEVKVTVAGAVDSRFAVTLPAAKMVDTLKAAKSADVATITAGNTTAGFDIGAARLSLPQLPVTDFPDMAKPETGVTFSIPLAGFRAGLNRVLFAVSKEETRYYLKGVYLHLRQTSEGGAVGLRMVATDGYRLASYDVEGQLPGLAELGPGGMPGVIVPRLAVATILKAMTMLQRAKRLPDSVQMTTAGNLYRLTFGPVQITGKLVDGTFPDYERVIPRANGNKSVMNVDAFRDAVKQAITMTDEKAAKVRLEFADGRCTISVNNPESGTASLSIGAAMTGEPVTIAFNARFLLDATADIAGDTFTMALDDAASPALIADAAAPQWLSVLMPMQV